MPTAPSPLPGVHEHETTSFLSSSNGSNNLSHTRSTLPKPVALHLLENITNGFSEDRELGRGGYGRVYKGELESGEIIAVKVLRTIPGLDDKLFKKEILNNASLHHENIVRLVGFCRETRQELVWHNSELVFAESIHMAICFEYMPNGSLDGYLFDECSGPDWPTRYRMIKDICVGLEYLHKELKPPLYHLDLKPSNILFNGDMIAKLADFGTSGFFRQELTQITGSCIGTPGYMPPEYIDRKIISNKFDIFSLGVIIIQLISGPTGYTQCDEMPSEQFIEIVHEKWRNRLQETSQDGMEQYSEQLMRCIEMALSCVEKEYHKRPDIGYIIDKLNEMEAKYQGSSDQVLPVDIWSTPTEASPFPATSCTPQETSDTKENSRQRKHTFSTVADLLYCFHKFGGQETMKMFQAMRDAELLQRARHLELITGKLQVIHSVFCLGGTWKFTRKVVVKTWVRQVPEQANGMEDSYILVEDKEIKPAQRRALLRELRNGRRPVDLSQVERLPVPDGSVIPGSGRPRKDFPPDGRRRSRKEMPASTGRRRSPACLHAWRCQQPK